MKLSYWLFLVWFGCAMFQPFIMAGTLRLREKFLSNNQRRLLGKVKRTLFILTNSFLVLLGLLGLASAQRNGSEVKMSISNSWLLTIAVAAVCITALSLLKERYSAAETY
ncbi:hypothetical protein [Hymenobacter sp. DG01]|uniref:hypothetical protein n=1 Tax=Hymenobacter sp. DG01 TaxID=2584940 RepID=UPI0011230C9A|nr:hypothetical protein [Hymenobacter sp. DG01]